MKDHLRKMLDAVVAGDNEAAQASFHNYVVDKSKTVFETADCKDPVGGEGTKDPKDAQGKKVVGTTEKDEIKAGGKSADDPSKAKSSKDVTGTMSKASKAEIKKGGESASDPKQAPGAKDVKATVKKASEKDITSKKS